MALLLITWIFIIIIIAWFQTHSFSVIGLLHFLELWAWRTCIFSSGDDLKNMKTRLYRKGRIYHLFRQCCSMDFQDSLFYLTEQLASTYFAGKSTAVSLCSRGNSVKYWFSWWFHATDRRCFPQKHPKLVLALCSAVTSRRAHFLEGEVEQDDGKTHGKENV